MFVATFFHTHHAVRVLLGENFSILDWLDRGVVVVLVDLLVDSSLSLFDAGLGDSLVRHGWVDSLMHRGVVMTGLLPKVT